MNTFYILLYNAIYDETTSLYTYLESLFPFTKENSFIRVHASKTLKNMNLVTIVLSQHLYKFVEWYPKYIEFENKNHHSYFLKKKMEFMLEWKKNPFYTISTQSQILDIYQKLQKHYFAFCRLAWLWKYKKAIKTPVTTTDLMFNELDLSNVRNIPLYQNKSIYWFNLKELMRLFEGSLCYSWEDDFVVSSETPFNPYNRLVFKKYHLYNIYFHMHFSTPFVIPLFFHLWYLEDFNTYHFSNKHNKFVQTLCIKHYIRTVDYKSKMLYQDICEMLSTNRYTSKWKIHQDFPRDILVNTLKPLLEKYYFLAYDIISHEERLNEETNLWNKLTQLYKKNPLFGRLKVKLSKTFKSFPFDSSTLGIFRFGEKEKTDVAINLDTLFSEESIQNSKPCEKFDERIIIEFETIP